MFRIKIFNGTAFSNAFTRESKDLREIHKWAKNLRKHFLNNTMTIQRIERGIWQDWQLIT